MMRAPMLAALVCALAIPAVPPAQIVVTYSEASLGYPVPLPVESLTPVPGFRSYAALRARQTDLALVHDHITMHLTGESLEENSIYTYRFSSPGATTFEGITKGAAMVAGTIHAREWASPEAVMAAFEWLALEGESDPLAAYILDALEVVIHPIGNPDGFLQTQRYPDQTVTGSWGEQDGRYRRKNMRGVDHDLFTLADYANGVDLNRNHSNGWTLRLAQSEVYGGDAIGSEPESDALYAAETLFDAARLRLYIDVHSAIPAYYVGRDALIPGYDDAAMDCYRLMSGAIMSTSGLFVPSINVDIFRRTPTTSDDPIGATDEYFGEKYGCMSYTAEIRRPFTGSKSFILPDSQVEIMREENLAAKRAALYYAAGPASVVGVDVYTSPPGDAPVYTVQWTATDPSGPRAAESIGGPVAAGVASIVAVRFNKPMRDVSGIPLPGVINATMSMQVVGHGPANFLGWADDVTTIAPNRFARDTALFEVAVPHGVAMELSVQGTDAAGEPIDADPATVADWSREGWVGAEAGPFVIVIPTLPASAVSDGWVLQ